jgi:hypothetical protein
MRLGEQVCYLTIENTEQAIVTSITVFVAADRAGAVRAASANEPT